MLLLEDATVRAVMGRSIADLVAEARHVTSVISAIGIDIPIGIPLSGQREADRTARQHAGVRRNSVFMTPVRAALQAPSFAEANAVNRERAGQGVSKQAYALAPRILQVDAWLETCGERVFEVHPELSFAELNKTPLTCTKKTWAGVHLRRVLLAAEGIKLPDDLGEVGRVCGVDDVLDAAVAAWSARRAHEDTPSPFPTHRNHLLMGPSQRSGSDLPRK